MRRLGTYVVQRLRRLTKLRRGCSPTASRPCVKKKRQLFVAHALSLPSQHSRRLMFCTRPPSEPRAYGSVKKPWDSQPRLKTPLIVSDFWDAACDSPRFFHRPVSKRSSDAVRRPGW